ncbi:MAG: tetratricopeptide repeat protein [Calditrichales bacterium]|nr:MAG: tetratricopeptide repeat protein [Calditrichales bacterium]
MKKIVYILLSSGLLLISCGKREIYKVHEISRDHEMKARDHFTTGMFFELENKHENALIEFYQALLYDSTSATIYNRIAENHMALGRYESALRYLEKSLNLRPNFAETFRLMADCHYRLKNDDESIEYLKKVLVLDPFDDNARSLLLILYRKTNNFIGLAQQYEQMIYVYGEDEDWVRKAATIYLENEQFDDAEALFRQYVYYDSTNAGMWFSLGITQQLKGATEQALVSYQRATELSPRVTEAAERIFEICRKEQKWEELIDIFNRFIETPQVTVYRLGVAEAYISRENKDFEKAEAAIDPLLDQKNAPWQAYDIMGRIQWGKRNFTRAADNFQRIIDIDSHNRIGWIFKGFVLSDSDSINKAELHYQSALKYLPQDHFLLTFHGIMLQRLNRDEEAILQFRQAISIDSTYVNALVSYGISLNRLQRFEEAITPLKKALKLEADNYTALTTLGMLYDQLKQYAACDSLYENALKHYPEDPLFLNNYAYTLAERGERLDKALEMAKTAVKAEPENGAYQDTIGWIYFQLKNYNLALFHITKSIENRESSAVVYEHLGDVYLKLKDYKSAIEKWLLALEIDKENERLINKIENTRKEL